MAGFFKKIFSFGKKEVVEERIDETAPLPPIKWEALDALKPAARLASRAPVLLPARAPAEAPA
ncbi:signal recognition particle-docking protein FtsY, partial [Mesorhizobium sp. M7A.T.Ca.TU.009.01.1.1]